MAEHTVICDSFFIAKVGASVLVKARGGIALNKFAQRGRRFGIKPETPSWVLRDKPQFFVPQGGHGAWPQNYRRGHDVRKHVDGNCTGHNAAKRAIWQQVAHGEHNNWARPQLAVKGGGNDKPGGEIIA